MSRMDTWSRFSFHKPDDHSRGQMRAIRISVRELAFLIEDMCPPSREKETALTNLATVMMNANSAIVQEYPIDGADHTAEERTEFLLDVNDMEEDAFPDADEHEKNPV